MPYPAQSLYFTLLFRVNGSDETAVTGFHVSSTSGAYAAEIALSGIEPADLDAVAEAYLELVVGSTPVLWPGYSILHGVKVAALDVDGHYLTDAVVRELPSPFGGSGTTPHPQLSLCMSLWSGSSIGKGNYGRMYLPHTCLPLETGLPRSSQANASTLSALGSQFITDINALVAGGLGTAGQVMILGKTGAGTRKPVSSVRIGRVTDTQRRRRDALIEDYQTTAVA